MSAGTLTFESVGVEMISGIAGAVGSECCNVFTEGIEAESVSGMFGGISSMSRDAFSWESS